MVTKDGVQHSAAMTRILVTGGSGFLGSHLIDVLVGQGHDVRVFDRVRSRWLSSSVSSVIGDINDAGCLAEAVADREVVYHLAGFSDLNAAKTRPVETVEANILGTVRLMETMRVAGVERLLFASTAYVYSRQGGFYRCSKQACESYIEEYARTFGMRYTILRFGSLYGPRADASNGVYRLLRTAMTAGRISYSGGPDDVREYIHVEDAARLAAELLAPQFESQHVMLTGHSSTRAAELFMMFQEILGRPLEIEYGQSAGPSSGHYAVTPYAYTPRPGKKVVTTSYVDMGQGLLRMVEELDRELSAGESR